MSSATFGLQISISSGFFFFTIGLLKILITDDRLINDVTLFLKKDSLASSREFIF